MNKRPDFKAIKSYEEFIKYYWYRNELVEICKQLGIDHSGIKQELNHRIKEYFNGNLIKSKPKQIHKHIVTKITLDTPLLECGFAFNQKFKQFFSNQTGITNFKFTADMAASWRKVKQDNDTTFTLQNMLDIYYHKLEYAKYDNSSCQWNQFLKDFCSDKRNTRFKNKLKVASILWKIVRDSSLPKVYNYDLVIKYNDLLKE